MDRVGATAQQSRGAMRRGWVICASYDSKLAGVSPCGVEEHTQVGLRVLEIICW